MGKQSVEQNGQLSQQPLAELIREAVATGLSGAFRLAQEQIKSVLYFDSGDLLFAVSNVRAHRLTELARRWNFVSEQQLQELGPQSSDAHLGVALVNSGVITTDALSELFNLQATTVLRPMLLWTEGTWSFDPRVRLAEEVRVQFALRDLLMESARRMPPEFVFKRFGNPNEILSPVPEPPMEIALQPAEAFILSRIDKGMHLHELLTLSGLPEADTLAAVYSLAFGGFVERNSWMRAFNEDIVNRFREVDAKLRSASKTAAPAKSSQPEKPADAGAPASNMPAQPVDEKEEIERFFLRVESAEDFFEVLAVSQSADNATIKRAYHGLARRFHPDRFHQETGTPLHARLQTTFARVAQAYEMLKDSKLRASYNLRVQSERKLRSSRSFTQKKPSPTVNEPSTSKPATTTTSNVPPPSASAPENVAEESFQKGMAALKAGNMAHAIAYLAEAARRSPKEARYRATYGRALSSGNKTRHKAEAELKAAIELDGNNASYRLMLAQLYREIGMKKRAQGEAQRALVIEPNNVEALRLIQDLGNSG